MVAAFAGFVLASTAVVETCRVHIIGERLWNLKWMMPSADRPDFLFATLRKDLPEEAQLGFVSDLPDSDGERGAQYLRARYALVPHVVVPRPERDLVVARLKNPLNLSSVCAREHLVPIRSYENGVALLRKDNP